MLQDLHYHLQNTSLLPPRSRLLLAVSGGVDSVVLLDLLDQLNDYYNWQIAVAHLDHKVRSDSTEDASLVAQLADERGYKFYLGQLSGSETREAALRKARYNFLESIRDGGNYDYIVTAHHADDRLETSIFNAIRGADRLGLTALQPARGKVLRPLLPFDKAGIITYAGLRNLPYREDSTNSDLRFSRNFVRHELMPQGSLNYRNFRSKYATSLDTLDSLNARINSQLDQLVDILCTKQGITTYEVDLEKWQQLSKTIKPYVLEYIFKLLRPGVELSQSNIEQAVHFFDVSKVGVSTHLSTGLHLIRDYASVIITLTAPRDKVVGSDTIVPLRSGQIYQSGMFRLKHRIKPVVTMAPQTYTNTSDLYVRYWQPGDRVKPYGMTGSKKLQDVFVDQKVPRNLRRRWPIVVTADNQVVWVPTLANDRRYTTNQADQATAQLVCELV